MASPPGRREEVDDITALGLSARLLRGFVAKMGRRPLSRIISGWAMHARDMRERRRLRVVYSAAGGRRRDTAARRAVFESWRDEAAALASRRRRSKGPRTSSRLVCPPLTTKAR